MAINTRNPPVLPQLSTPADVAEQMRRTEGPAGRPAVRQVEEKHAEQVAETPPRRMSAADAERLVSQSGFVRTKKRGRELVLDGAADQPIPLPVEEVDEEAWKEGRNLDDAQEKLAVHGAQLNELARAVRDEGPGETGVFGRLIAMTFSPTEADVERLRALAEGSAPPPAQLGGVKGSVGALFGIELEHVSQGASMAAVSLIVAGHGEAVVPEGETLAAEALAEGLQKVVQDGTSAAEDVRRMNRGIEDKLALQRTFLYRR